MKSPLLEGQHTQFYRLVHNWKIWFKKPIMPAIIFNLLVSIKQSISTTIKTVFQSEFIKKECSQTFQIFQNVKKRITRNDISIKFSKKSKQPLKPWGCCWQLARPGAGPHSTVLKDVIMDNYNYCCNYQNNEQNSPVNRLQIKDTTNWTKRVKTMQRLLQLVKVQNKSLIKVENCKVFNQISLVEMNWNWSHWLGGWSG